MNILVAITWVTHCPAQQVESCRSKQKDLMFVKVSPESVGRHWRARVRCQSCMNHGLVVGRKVFQYPGLPIKSLQSHNTDVVGPTGPREAATVSQPGLMKSGASFTQPRSSRGYSFEHLAPNTQHRVLVSIAGKCSHTKVVDGSCKYQESTGWPPSSVAR